MIRLIYPTPCQVPECFFRRAVTQNFSHQKVSEWSHFLSRFLLDLSQNQFNLISTIKFVRTIRTIQWGWPVNRSLSNFSSMRLHTFASLICYILLCSSLSLFLSPLFHLQIIHTPRILWKYLFNHLKHACTH